LFEVAKVRLLDSWIIRFLDYWVFRKLQSLVAEPFGFTQDKLRRSAKFLTQNPE
jgi:hypothetical protein